MQMVRQITRNGSDFAFGMEVEDSQAFEVGDDWGESSRGDVAASRQIPGSSSPCSAIGGFASSARLGQGSQAGDKRFREYHSQPLPISSSSKRLCDRHDFEFPQSASQSNEHLHATLSSDDLKAQFERHNRASSKDLSSAFGSALDPFFELLASEKKTASEQRQAVATTMALIIKFKLNTPESLLGFVRNSRDSPEFTQWMKNQTSSKAFTIALLCKALMPCYGTSERVDKNDSGSVSFLRSSAARTSDSLSSRSKDSVDCQHQNIISEESAVSNNDSNRQEDADKVANNDCCRQEDADMANTINNEVAINTEGAIVAANVVSDGHQPGMAAHVAQSSSTPEKGDEPIQAAETNHFDAANVVSSCAIDLSKDDETCDGNKDELETDFSAKTSRVLISLPASCAGDRGRSPRVSTPQFDNNDQQIEPSTDEVQPVSHEVQADENPAVNRSEDVTNTIIPMSRIDTVEKPALTLPTNPSKQPDMRAQATNSDDRANHAESSERDGGKTNNENILEDSTAVSNSHEQIRHVAEVRTLEVCRASPTAINSVHPMPHPASPEAGKSAGIQDVDTPPPPTSNNVAALTLRTPQHDPSGDGLRRGLLKLPVADTISQRSDSVLMCTSDLESNASKKASSIQDSLAKLKVWRRRLGDQLQRLKDQEAKTHETERELDLAQKAEEQAAAELLSAEEALRAAEARVSRAAGEAKTARRETLVLKAVADAQRADLDASKAEVQSSKKWRQCSAAWKDNDDGSALMVGFGILHL